MCEVFAVEPVLRVCTYFALLANFIAHGRPPASAAGRYAGAPAGRALSMRIRILNLES